MIIFKYLNTAWGILTFVLMLFGAVTLAFVTSFRGKATGEIVHRYIHFWGKTWLKLIGVKLHVVDREQLDREENYIFVANHAAYGDVPAMVAAIEHSITAIGKKEVEQIPVMGYLFKRVIILVNRADKASRSNSVALARSKTKAEALSLVVFPEGTFNDNTGDMLPFKSGAFRLALELQMPIAPITLIGTKDLLNNYKLPINRCKMTAVFLPPIDTKGMDVSAENIQLLKSQTRQLMETELKKHF